MTREPTAEIEAAANRKTHISPSMWVFRSVPMITASKSYSGVTFARKQGNIAIAINRRAAAA
jgi:hypothetical protein